MKSFRVFWGWFLETAHSGVDQRVGLLDMGLCNERGLVDVLIIKPPLNYSNHNMIEFYIQFLGKKRGSRLV